MDVKILSDIYDAQLTDILKAGGTAVLRTDTLYGIVSSAMDQSAVQRVYEIKRRTALKPPIVLISNIRQLLAEPSLEVKRQLGSYWPGKNSLILPADKNAPTWLTRGSGAIAYRLPDDINLRKLIESVGPIIAPSANPEGLVPASSVGEAVAYFGSEVDIYIDGGKVEHAEPSKLFRINDEHHVERLR